MPLSLLFSLPSGIAIANQLFQLEQKLTRREDTDSLLRHVSRLRELVLDAGLAYESPLGQRYSETRTDCDATLSGQAVGDLRIVEVIKPLVLLRQGDADFIVQKAVVIVAAS